MKFSTREDIEAPVDHVWASVTDFKGFERQALRRGSEVSRRDPLGQPGLDTEWDIRLSFRGRARDVSARVVAFDPPNGLRVDSGTSGLDGELTVELVSLSPRRTRLHLAVELKPRNLTGRLLIQSMKFAKSGMKKRFCDRVYDFAQDIEGKYINEG